MISSTEPKWDPVYTVHNTYNFTNYFREYLNSHRSVMLTRSASGEILKQSVQTDTSTASSNVDPYISYVGMFSSTSEQEYNIQTPTAKVLLYDNRTGYFNATHLVHTISVLNISESTISQTTDVSNKDFSKLLHFKGFADTLELLEQDLNSDNSVINKSLPNYDPKRGSVVACYNLKHPQFSGTYVHPSLLSFIMLYANHNIMLDMSRFMIHLFCGQVSRKQLSVDQLLETIQTIPEQTDFVHYEKITTYKHDIMQEQHAEKIARKEAAKRKREADKQKGIKKKKGVKRPKFTTDTVKREDDGDNCDGDGRTAFVTGSITDEDIDVSLLADSAIDSLIDFVETKQQERESKNISIKPDTTAHSVKKSSKTNSIPRKRKPVSLTSLTQGLIIIIPAVQTTELQQIKFITCLLSDLKLYEKQIPRGWIIHSTFINLRNLPTDLARRFNKDYEDEIETDIQIDTNGEVMLLIDSIDSFDEHIPTFLADWMII